MRRLPPILAGMLAFGALRAADAPPPAPEVPASVLAQAAAVAQAKPVKPPEPSAAAVQTADRVDALLLAATNLLARKEPVTAGERFVQAVTLMESLAKEDRRALGPRYRDLRTRLTACADVLLKDPEVSAAFGDAPLAPAPAEKADAVGGSPF